MRLDVGRLITEALQDEMWRQRTRNAWHVFHAWRGEFDWSDMWASRDCATCAVGLWLREQP